MPPVVSWDLQAGILTKTAKVQTLASISPMKTCKSWVMTVKPETCLLHQKHQILRVRQQLRAAAVAFLRKLRSVSEAPLLYCAACPSRQAQLKHDTYWPSVVSWPGEATAPQAGDSLLQWQASP